MTAAMIGYQRPRFFHAPPSLGGVGREAVDLAALAGLHLDDWEQWCLEQMLMQTDQMFYNEILKDYQRKWVAREAGLVVSRQNGKGSILEARELAGLFLLGERLIIHSAHQFDTSKEAFERIMMLIENTPDFDAEISRVSRSHGEEGVELRNGQRLRFRTRTKGGGRGFTGDCLILDEAMILGKQMVAALMPVVSARPNAQIIYTGSAGDKESTQLGRVRKRALDSIDPDRKFFDPSLFYAEWSIDPHTDECPVDCDEHDAPDSVESYRKANPGYGIRITLETIEAERRSMDADTFAAERLGVGDWPVEGEAWTVIEEKPWRDQEVSELSEIDDDNFVLAVDVSPSGKYSCIVACGRTEEDFQQVEITGVEEYDHRPGTQWLVPRIVEIWKGTKPAAVVIDKASQAGSIIDDLEAEGIKVITPGSREYAQACGDFKLGIMPRKGNQPTIVHLGQQTLDNAVAGAEKRDVSDMWVWSRRTSSVDITPLVAATLAAWGNRKMRHDKPAASAPWAHRA